MTATRRPLASLLILGVGAACTPIVDHPLSTAPLNVCPTHPCEAYGSEQNGTQAKCTQGACEVPTPSGRPTFPFWIQVNVPDTSIYAPGSTYTFYSDASGAPAFTKRVPEGVVSRCIAPKCLELDGLSTVVASYAVTKQGSKDAGQPLNDGQKIPATVVYQPTGIDQAPPDTFPAPNLLFAAPLNNAGDSLGIHTSRVMPYGTYRRILYPQAPFDAFFPPSTFEGLTIGAPNTIDAFTLGATTDGPDSQGKPLPTIDDPGGTSREATVTRTDGLDGWRLWLADASTKERISVLKTLSDTTATVRLDTTGQSTSTGGLRDGVIAVLSPPESWTAAPTYVTPLFGGQGLDKIVYDPLPPPVTVDGVVAVPSASGPLYGYPARISFTSTQITTVASKSTLLQYATALSTDDRGRFSSVLPPGTYDITVEPLVGTGQAKKKLTDVIVDRTVTALTLETPVRPLLHGRVFLADGRPVGSANILATADTEADTAADLEPRPGATTTAADGTFALELDPGPYLLTVVPLEGTGFPRVVVTATVRDESAELPPIRVPPPTRLSFSLKDPSNIGNSIEHAVVRVFANLPQHLRTPTEIGNAISDGEGQVTILLAE
jgi:hypothetical protein